MKTLLFLVLLFAPGCYASDIYFAPTSVGGNKGTDCADAYAYNDLSNGINGTGTASWVAGNTLHLCGGTWNGASGQQWVSTRNGGSSSNPITIKFESGAVLSAPYHSVTGAIAVNHGYVVVDGGANGIIQNTADGTQGSPNCLNGSCSTQAASVLVRITAGSNIEVKNLTIGPTYVHDSVTNNNDTSGGTEYGVYSLGNSNVTLDHNLCHDANYCFTVWGSGTILSYNTAYNNAWQVGSGINTPVAGMQIDHNSFTQNCAWYTTSNSYHLNNVHLFSNSGSGNYSGVVIFDNYFGGGCNLGAQTGHLFLEGSYVNPRIFNNLFDNNTGGPFHYPCIWLATTTGGGGWSQSSPLVVNNTFLGSDYTTAGSTAFEYDSGVSGLTWQNNLVTGGKTILVLASAGRGGSGNFASNGVSNNAYDSTNNGGSANPFSYNQAAYTTFANYKAALPPGSGAESASIVYPPMTLAINANGTLRPGSPAIGLGANLTSLGIKQLTVGAPQIFGVSGQCGSGCIARPSAGPWDSGAYVYLIAPPQNVRVTGVQ